MIRTGTGSGTVGDAGEGLVNQGRISARTSEKTIDLLASTLGNTGVLEARSGGTLAVATGTPFANDGTLSAGAGGVISVDGPLTQTAGAAFHVEIGGTAADALGRMTVTEEAALGGSLNVSVVDGFIPAIGDEFEILTCGSRSGIFDEVTGWQVGGLVFPPIYEGQRVFLHATIMGDANLDGQVGIADLSALADNYGRTADAQWVQADFNLDGQVGIADLSALADNYGRSTPMGGQQLPEPASLSVLMLGAALLATRRRRR